MGVIIAEKPKQLLGLRHLQALMLFFGTLLSSFIMSNMSIAIVAMTDDTQENAFDWSLQTQNIVLSSYKWGSVILVAVSGELMRICGGVSVYICVHFVNGALCLLTPVAATYGGWQAVSAFRCIQGMFNGINLTCIMFLMSTWVPKEEKGRLLAFTFSGMSLGTGIQLVTSGYMAVAWGWQVIFYVDGTLCAIWCVAYYFLGADSPQQSKLISQKELDYIQSSLQQDGKKKKLKTPWKAILTSVPVWAVVISSVGYSWGFWTILTQITIYMDRVLGLDTKTNGLLSALPHFTHCVITLPVGYVSDYILNKKWVSIDVSRKLSNSIATFGPAICLVAMCYAPANATVFTILLCFVVSLFAGYLTGDNLVYLDMSPNFASQVFGFSSFVASMMSQCAPLVSGLFVKDDTNAAEWRIVFLLTAGLYIVTNIVFLVFGSTDRQPWNEPPPEVTDAEANVKK